MTSYPGWGAWSFQPIVILALLAAAVVYARVYRRARERSSTSAPNAGHWVPYAAGLVTIAVALLSPLDPIGEHLALIHQSGERARDLVEAMTADAGAMIGVIRVDGGMAASDWTMQFVSDMLGVAVDRPANLESTALGAAFAAGWQAGVMPGPESFAERRRRDRVFTPDMDDATREALYRGWREAVRRAL